LFASLFGGNPKRAGIIPYEDTAVPFFGEAALDVHNVFLVFKADINICLVLLLEHVHHGKR
jgi:hypothetical protein